LNTVSALRNGQTCDLIDRLQIRIGVIRLQKKGNSIKIKRPFSIRSLGAAPKQPQDCPAGRRRRWEDVHLATLLRGHF
jgi:hypothetical protein